MLRFKGQTSQTNLFLSGHLFFDQITFLNMSRLKIFLNFKVSDSENDKHSR